jgi:signal transduction histidine kinase
MLVCNMGNDRTQRMAWVRAVASPFGLLALAAVAAVAVIGAVLTLELHRLSGDDAIHEAAEQAALAGRGVVAPRLTRAAVRGDPAALARLDEAVRPLLITTRVIRIKVWDASGRIVYSDEPRLIGERFGLDPDDRALLLSGGEHASRTDLAEPENRFERGHGKMTATYVGIKGPDGEPMLYESYETLSAFEADSGVLWRQMLPPLLGGLLLLQVANLLLARWFSRRVRREDRERAELLRRAVSASDAERRRLVADLHDGVVQDLTAISFALAGAHAADGPRLDAQTADLLERAAATTRESVRALRTLLVEVYPPDLAAIGLGRALEDLTTAARLRGLEAELAVADDLAASPEASILLFRAAQEGVRNAVTHSGARRLEVQAAAGGGHVWLEVRDDGVGFDETTVAGNGHFGLRALADMLEDAAGHLDVRTAPGQGTVLRAEVPTS